MILVERHIINNRHHFFKECDKLSFLSKNLYNKGLYNVRQHYFMHKEYLSYVKNFHLTKNEQCYKDLPAKVSNQILILLDKNFKSFFELLKMGLKTRVPKYLDKDKGRYIVKYEKQALGIGHFKKIGEILLSKTNISIKTKIVDWNSIKEVRIIPKNNHYVIEVVYEKLEKINNGNITASIDLGLNNLSTITFNDGRTPFIINGRPLKSINNFYNKKKSILQSELEIKQKRKASKNLTKLTNKRNNKINDYLHKASRVLVNQLVSNQVNKLIIGKNIGQKQDSKMNRVNNQNFINIPIFRFLEMVYYKSKIEGIEVIWQEESYTSKSSFLDLDFIPIYGDDYKGSFSGRRIKRGLYKSSKGIINADVNGSYNIMRKAIPNLFNDGIEGFAVIPFKLKV
jgi:IS605 OrfB family transposase